MSDETLSRIAEIRFEATAGAAARFSKTRSCRSVRGATAGADEIVIGPARRAKSGAGLTLAAISDTVPLAKLPEAVVLAVPDDERL